MVPRERVFPESYPQGFRPFGQDLRLDAFAEVVHEHGFFVERDYAERTPMLKQIIPYTVVLTGGEVLLMRRLNKGGEGRLHGKLSIGVGGHINPEDASSDVEETRQGSSPDVIRAGTWREISEEISLEGSTELTPIGVINDDATAVGAVHLGLAQILTVDGPVRIAEEDVLEGELVPPHRLRTLLADGANFETWSSFLIDTLDELIPKPLPALS